MNTEHSSLGNQNKMFVKIYMLGTIFYSIS